jgi:7,8-dihydropterin-6-yl-methyl-4-(beta-D-ribofuranosyl)aminobenzene 5'-phosphate synthase
MPAFKPPVVDALSVRVVVDSHYERFLPEASHPSVRIEHLGRVPGRHMTTLAAEWGLSLHLHSTQAGIKAQYLLDFGYTPEIVNRNFDLLDIDSAAINGLILSHGHRDHFGGLDGFVMRHRSHMRDDLSLYVGGETALREKWIKEKDPEYIARQSFEEVTGGTLVAEDDHYTEDERKGQLVLDQHPDEHATCHVVKGRCRTCSTLCASSRR